MNEDKEILELALKSLSEEFNDFIKCCLDDKMKPIAPSNSNVARARACLPPYCELSFKKKEKTK